MERDQFIRDRDDSHRSVDGQPAPPARAGIDWEQRAAEIAAELQVTVNRLARSTAELEAARRANDQLAAKLNEARAEARRARETAEALNRARMELLARLSHELRAPLTAVAGYTELLLSGARGVVNARQEEGLERIRRNTEHLRRLIEGILELAKVELGHAALDVTELSVEQLVSAAEDIILPQMCAKGLSYTRAPVAHGLRCRADREKAVQILVNLLSNAVKFTPPGGSIRLEVTAAPEALELAVIDSGCGIPPQGLERIFDPFVSLSTGGERTGTGLGLAISRDLARAMGGELIAASVVGEGSRFTLSLPHARAA
jgi:signal transduction histidine kinase